MQAQGGEDEDKGNTRLRKMLWGTPHYFVGPIFTINYKGTQQVFHMHEVHSPGMWNFSDQVETMP